MATIVNGPSEGQLQRLYLSTTPLGKQMAKAADRESHLHLCFTLGPKSRLDDSCGFGEAIIVSDPIFSFKKKSIHFEGWVKLGGISRKVKGVLPLAERYDGEVPDGSVKLT